MRVLCIFLLAFGISHATERRCTDFFEHGGPIVKTVTGTVLGKYVEQHDTEIAGFFGIPYAKPPLGERRFTKAEPIEPWNGILRAQEEASPCIQQPPQFLKFAFPDVKYSEDCLYLNVWAPNNRCGANFEKLPVMVFIHGGGFSMGAADTDMQDGSKLVAHGQVVVVSMNYRLGPLGFLNAGNEEAPGNIGLMDQVLAMRWVKDNIEFFGGDPENVTIFGISAGSWSVSLHLISPMSRNLFQRAIMQSGSMYNSYLTDSPEAAKRKSNALAVALGCADDNVNLNSDPATVMECLRAADSITLAKLDMKLRSNTFTYASAGNEFLPKHPVDAYESGNIAPVEAMMGVMRDEGTMFLPWWAPEFFSFQEEPKLSLEDVQKAIPSVFIQLPYQVHSKIFNYYFRDIAGGEHAAITEAMQTALGDYLFNCPVMFLGDKLDPAYMYWMTHESVVFDGIFPDWIGVPHGADMLYLFGKTMIPGITLLPRDKKFHNDILETWINFARKGFPIADESRQQWPQFSSSDNTTYELNEGNYKTIPFPRREHCKFWRSIIAPDTCTSDTCSSI